jgi:hypothetical protein
MHRSLIILRWVSNSKASVLDDEAPQGYHVLLRHAGGVAIPQQSFRRAEAIKAPLDVHRGHQGRSVCHQQITHGHGEFAVDSLLATLFQSLSVAQCGHRGP